jgi:hypothetical protein
VVIVNTALSHKSQDWAIRPVIHFRPRIMVKKRDDSIAIAYETSDSTLTAEYVTGAFEAQWEMVYSPANSEGASVERLPQGV